jgi:tetratricopeptide (TPR) repeat protein
MDDLLADLRADKTRRLRIAFALVASIVLVGGGAWAAVHEQAARKVRMCRANIDKAAAVWPFDTAKNGAISPGTPTAIRDAFLRSGVADAGGIFQRVSGALSAYLEQWAHQATDACEATHVRREQSRDELALRMACLDERLSAARAVTDTLMHADAKVVAHATDAALGLPDLDRCTALPLLRAVRPPEGATKQAEVTRLRRRMAEVKLLVETGHFDVLGADLKALERDVRAVGYPPLLVDFLSFLHFALYNGADPGEEAGRVREALRVAETAGYDEGIAHALMGVAWTEYRNPTVSDLALDQADAVLHRLGDPPVLRAWFENDVSFIKFGTGRLAESLKHAQRSLALKEQRRPYDARDVALSESNICLILGTGGRAREALPHCDRSVEVITALLGWAHPNAMNLAENRAFVLTELGSFDEGCGLADRVRSFFEEAGEHIEARPVLVPTLARCGLERGRPGDVRELLERALEAATRAGATTMETAGIEWELARNVYAGDHRRGLEMADRAAKHYATLPELAFRARDVRAWIAARRGVDR